MSKRPTISVAVITYNQHNTICQTLDSILAQKGEFDLELVIGEDCSSDNTYDICLEYEKKYPNVVMLLPNTHNLGIMENTARVYMASCGDFISLIAGDDYYCDDHALEKQMLYMQNHQEVGVLASNGYQYIVRKDKTIAGFNPIIEAGHDRAKQFYFSPSYKGGIYLWPVGMMVRRNILQYIDFETIIQRKLPVEDYPMQAIWSQHTRFACLPDLFVTYRVYSGSASFISYDNPQYMAYCRGLVETRRYLNELFPKDVCFTEKMLQEQLFYNEFLLYVHRRDYCSAKRIISNAPHDIADSVSMNKAKRFTRSYLYFITVYIVKELKYRIAMNRLT